MEGDSREWSPETDPSEERRRYRCDYMYRRALPRCEEEGEGTTDDFSTPVIKAIMERWTPRKTQIAQVELLAVVTAIKTWGPELEGKRTIVLVDSESALGAAIKGYSAKSDISELVSELWKTISMYGMIVYFDRISTDANISDGPSRNQLTIAKDCDWQFKACDWE